MSIPADANPAVRDTASPPIPGALAWTRRYDGRLGALLDLSQAVPGYPPHPELLARIGVAAASPEAAAYGPIPGDRDLRAAFAAELSAGDGAPVARQEVAITAGCNQAFFVAMIAVARAGDNVILPLPWYFNHKMTTDMLGIEARPLATQAAAGFLPDPAAAEGLIDGRTRAIVLVSPNNPTGAVYPAASIAAFRRLAAARGLWLVLDETYRDFRPEGTAHGLAGERGWQKDCVRLHSFSKSYCIPGHRLGAIVAGAGLQAEIAKILDCVQICPPRAAQPALAWAIGALGAWRRDNRAVMAERAGRFRAAVAAAPGWRIDQIGAYFAYVRHPFAGPAAAVAEALAADRGVLALPGSYFGPGQEGHLRMAFANLDADRIDGLAARLAGFTIGEDRREQEGVREWTPAG